MTGPRGLANKQKNGNHCPGTHNCIKSICIYPYIGNHSLHMNQVFSILRDSEKFYALFIKRDHSKFGKCLMTVCVCENRGIHVMRKSSSFHVIAASKPAATREFTRAVRQKYTQITQSTEPGPSSHFHFAELSCHQILHKTEEVIGLD